MLYGTKIIVMSEDIYKQIKQYVDYMRPVLVSDRHLLSRKRLVRQLFYFFIFIIYLLFIYVLYYSSFKVGSLQCKGYLTINPGYIVVFSNVLQCRKSECLLLQSIT